MSLLVPDYRKAVSIVCSTCRLGGLDVLTEMARTQTFRDFELILVDYFYGERRALVAGLAPKMGLEPECLIHVPPRTGCWQIGASAGQAYNTGFALASGELVLPMGDFQFQYPQWLEDHWRVYTESGRIKTLAGDFAAIVYPKCVYNHKKPERSLFSVFEPVFTVDAFLRGLSDSSVIYSTRRGDYLTPDGQLRPDAFNATQNESIPLRVLNTLNGFDEVYDGGRGYQDQDMGYRLRAARHPVVFVPGLKPALHIWTHQTRANPQMSSTLGGASWAPSGQRNADLLASRVALGDSYYPIRAINGGWNISDEHTSEEVIDMAGSVRPARVFPFSQLEPAWVVGLFSAEPSAGSPTGEVEIDNSH